MLYNRKRSSRYHGLAPFPDTRLTGCQSVHLSYPVTKRTGNSPFFLLPHTKRRKEIPSLLNTRRIVPSSLARFLRADSRRGLSWQGISFSLPVKVPRAGPDLFSPCDLSRPPPHRLRDMRSGGDRSLLKPFCCSSRAAVSALNCISLSVRSLEKKKKTTIQFLSRNKKPQHYLQEKVKNVARRCWALPSHRQEKGDCTPVPADRSAPLRASLTCLMQTKYSALFKLMTSQTRTVEPVSLAEFVPVI